MFRKIAAILNGTCKLKTLSFRPSNSLAPKAQNMHSRLYWDPSFLILLHSPSMKYRLVFSSLLPLYSDVALPACLNSTPDTLGNTQRGSRSLPECEEYIESKY